MAMPEVDAEERLLTSERFTRVDAIVEPGSYRFADDPNVAVLRPSLTIRRRENFVQGHRPMFEQTTVKALLKTPGIIKVPHHRTTLFGEERPPSRRPQSKLWSGENGGIMFRGQLYEIAKVTTVSRGQSDGHLLIEDTDSFRDGVILLPQQRENGSLMLSATGTNPDLLPADSCDWRGWIDVQGDNPGLLVQKTIRHINGQIKKLGLPLWRQI